MMPRRTKFSTDFDDDKILGDEEIQTFDDDFIDYEEDVLHDYKKRHPQAFDPDDYYDDY
jgi:hypothetical protein